MTAAEYVWGIDPSVNRLAFCFAPLGVVGEPEMLTGDTVGEPEVLTVDISSDAREGERLGLWYRKIANVGQALASQFPPTAVWVEQPSGKYRNLSLCYVVAVTMAAVYNITAVPVWAFAPTVWKHRTVGVGNASKAQVRAWVDARVSSVRSQDEADAVAIALAGRAMFTSRSWDASAA